jgi:hypothetical protein
MENEQPKKPMSTEQAYEVVKISAGLAVAGALILPITAVSLAIVSRQYPEQFRAEAKKAKAEIQEAASIVAKDIKQKFSGPQP